MTSNDVPQWDLADRLRKALRVAGVSVQDMAEELGIHRNTVSGYLNGQHAPSRAVLIVWAMRTGVPVEWLVHGGPDEGEDDTLRERTSRAV